MSGEAGGHDESVTDARGRREGWNAAEPETLPRRRTVWPAAAALGIVLIFFGVVTAWLVVIAGVVLLGIAVAGWIEEVRYDLGGEPHDH
jgi:hypothetical protein